MNRSSRSRMSPKTFTQTYKNIFGKYSCTIDKKTKYVVCSAHYKLCTSGPGRTAISCDDNGIFDGYDVYDIWH